MADVSADLLREAFLNPIRFALLIDDEFPAYGTAAAADDRALSLVGLCRGKGWLCDVENDIQKILAHDANDHLHQSDLLIVDFHLDRARENDASASIRLLQRLAGSPHFNLAVIYTGGVPEAVALEVAFGLGGGVIASDEEADAFTEMLERRDDELVLEPSIQVLRGLVGDEGAVAALNAEKQRLARLGVRIPEAMGAMAHGYFSTRMDAETISLRPQGLKLGCDIGAAVPWISTPNLFVAVVNKEEVAPEHLIDRLVDALEAWNPTPLQVLVVQARASLERAGSTHDEAVLSSPLVQAGWLLNVLSSDPDERARRLGDLYGQLFAGLAGQLTSTAGAFGAQVLGDAPAADALVGARTLSRLTENTPDAHVFHAANEFMSSTACASEGRIVPGMIFQAQLSKSAKQLWLCTTPSCDLVPGQSEGGWDGQIGPYKAVYAARLAPVSNDELETRLAQATYGRHLFLTVDGVPMAYEIADETKRQAKLEVLFVGEDGRYSGGEFEGLIIRETDGKPGFKAATFRALAQLRPGYANKFLIDAGMQKARIGLSWVGMRSPKVVPPPAETPAASGMAPLLAEAELSGAEIDA